MKTIAAILIAVALAACGGDDVATGPDADPGPDAAEEIEGVDVIGDWRFLQSMEPDAAICPEYDYPIEQLSGIRITAPGGVLTLEWVHDVDMLRVGTIEIDEAEGQANIDVQLDRGEFKEPDIFLSIVLTPFDDGRGASSTTWRNVNGDECGFYARTMERRPL